MQVPIDARNREKGSAAEPSPPSFCGWSVCIVNPLYLASTFLFPGNVIFMSMVFPSLKRNMCMVFLMMLL